MATVYKPERSKFWYCNYQVGDEPRVRKSTQRTNKKEAQRVADQWEREALDREQFGVIPELSFRDALGLYAVKHQNNPKARAEVRIGNICENIKAVQGMDPQMKFHKLTSTLLDQYQAQRLSDGVSKQTVNHEINLISAAYHLAKRDHRVNDRLQFPRFVIESTPRPLLEHELDALLEHLSPERKLLSRNGNEYTPHYSLGKDPIVMEQRQQNHDLVICLVDTGLRMGELCAVTWDVVDTKTWTFLIDRTKNKDKRAVSRHRTMRVHPTDRMKEILKRRYENRGNISYVFSKWKRIEDGRYLRENAPQKSTQSIREAMTKVGINSPENIARWRRRDVRSLRDTFATTLRQRGVGLEDIQELLGHSDMTMTMKYADAGLDDISANAASILKR